VVISVHLRPISRNLSFLMAATSPSNANIELVLSNPEEENLAAADRTDRYKMPPYRHTDQLPLWAPIRV
jgi:hypothetical protein